MKPKISFIAPSNRTHLWIPFYESIVTNLDFEVIFVTDKYPDTIEVPNCNNKFTLERANDNTYQLGNFKWIYSTVKPAQCFEIAYRESKGEFIIWTGDDFMYSPYAIDNLYTMHKAHYDYRVIVSPIVYEDGKSVSHLHKVPWDNSYQLTTTALISKQAIEEAGGFGDINFPCGHFDVDLMMRIYSNGGRIFLCPTAASYEPHVQFHRELGANFADTWKDELSYFTYLWRGEKNHEKGALPDQYYTLKERKVLFQPYSEKDILTVSQGMKGKWK